MDETSVDVTGEQTFSLEAFRNAGSLDAFAQVRSSFSFLWFVCSSYSFVCSSLLLFAHPFFVPFLVCLAQGESGGAFDRDVLAEEEEYNDHLAFMHGAPPSLRPAPINLDAPVEADDYEQEMEEQMEAAYLDFKAKRAARARAQPGVGEKVRGVKQRRIREQEVLAELYKQEVEGRPAALTKAEKEAQAAEDDAANSDSDLDTGGSDSEESSEEEPAVANDDSELEESSSDEEEEDDDDAQLGGAGGAGGRDAMLKRQKAERWFSQGLFDAGANEDDEAGSGEGGGGAEAHPDVQAMVEAFKTEKEKRHSKRVRRFTKEADKALRLKRKRERNGESLAIVFAGDGSGGAGGGAPAAKRTAAEQAAEDAKDDNDREAAPLSHESRELIRAGMGKAVASGSVGAADGEIEIVPATVDEVDSDAEMGGSGSGSESEGFVDNVAAGSVEHAKILAMGMLLRRGGHAGAKKLINEVSYNRYTFDDTELPAWFVEDEEAHNRPQLPVTKAMVNRIRARFQRISEKPLNKVAEARARKKIKLMAKLRRAKNAATAIAASEELSEHAKMKQMRAAVRGAKLTKPGKSYIINNKGNTSGGKLGHGLRMVDRRLKSDKRAMKKLEKEGAKRKKPKSKTRHKRKR